MTLRKTRTEASVPVVAATGTHGNARRQPSRVPLMLSTSLALIGGLGYVQRAYAQTVSQASLSTSNSATVELHGPGTFETQSGFSVNVTSGDAIEITTAPGYTPQSTDVTTFRDYSGGTIASSLNDGIKADIEFGSLEITTTSAINGGFLGIDADLGTQATNGTSNASDLSISAGSITSEYGVRTRNFGNGDLEITLSGDVVATDGFGIKADSNNTTATGNTLSITVGNVTSVDEGIDATLTGVSGTLNITSTGNIVSSDEDGVNAFLDSSAPQGAEMNISVHTVQGGNYGIFANTAIAPAESQAISITATGDVTGQNGSGIYVSGYGDFTINVGDVTGGGQSSGYDHGLSAYYINRGDLTVTGETFTGGSDGVFARHSYSGSPTSGNLSITGTTFTGQAGAGVRALHRGNGDITITANTATGAYDGINARHDGDGDLVITTTGTVTGQDGAAIQAEHHETGNLSVTTYGTLITQGGNFGNGTNGIWARHDGDGDLTVISHGAIDATAGDDGIDTEQSGTGDHVIVVNGDITAYHEGINADHDGTGLFSITVNGDIDADGDGIDADRDTGDGPAEGDMVLVVTGTVTAGSDAIHIDHEGDGRIDITVSGDLVADSDGIKLDHDGEGDIDIDVSGTITADGNIGIDIDHEGNGDITIAVNDVDADADGVQVDHSGEGALEITVNGDLGSASGDAIEATIAGEDDITIVIAADGHVQTSGTDDTDFAIQALASNGAVDVTNAGMITGAVDLSNSNVLRNTGTWSLAGTTSDFNATGDSLVENTGLILAAQDAEAGETSVIDNLDTFRNGTGGTIRLADGAAGDVFRIATSGSGSGDFVANGGTVEMDVVLGGDGSATDLLDISGDVILDAAPTALSFTPVGGGGGSTVTGIEVVRVGGASDAGAFTLAAPVELGALAYDLSLGDCTDQADSSWYLCNTGVSASGAVFEAMPGIILGHFARAEGLSQRLGSRITSRAVTASSRGSADTVDSAARRAVGPWLRTWGGRADVTPTTSSGGTSWEASSLGVQFGIAAALGDTAGGDLIGGLSFELNSRTADIENANGTGRVDMDGHGIGLSLTWFGHGGFYVDLNAARDWIDIDASSQTAGMLLDRHEEVVTSASAEIGRRFALDDATALVPQMQLSWSQLQGGSFTDAVGNSVTIADRETLTARLGLALERDVVLSGEGNTGKLYGFGNLLADLSADQTVTVGGTALSQGGRGNWAELGAGFSMSPDGESNLFGEIAYRSAFADVEGHAMSASLGWRVQW